MDTAVAGKQTFLGHFGFTKNSAPALAPSPDPNPPSLICSYCSESFSKINGRVLHEKYCLKNPVNIHEREECERVAEEFLPIFDWRAWAIRYAALAASVPSVVDGEKSDAEERNDGEAAEIDAMDIDGEEIMSEKEKRKRNRENLKSQIQILDLIPDIRNKLAEKKKIHIDAVTMNDILFVIQHNTGVLSSTVDKWVRRAPLLRSRYANKFNRAKFSFGPGRHPSFPQTEIQVASTIRERRLSSKIVTKDFVLTEIRKLAAVENHELFEKLKVGDDIFFAFMRRQRFSFRKPSNTKALTLESSQKIVRGFFQWLLKLLKDDFGDEIKRAKSMDPVEGSYPLDCRANKDEVLLILRTLF